MRILVVLALLAVCPLARPETVILTSVADTTLFEYSPDNNVGAYPSLAAGGINSEPRKTRALVRFNLAGNVPTEAQVTAARVLLRVVNTPIGGGANSAFGLHRVLKSWNEGSKAGHPRGALATAGETTWNSRFHGSEFWATPGGEAGTDYAATSSSTTAISGLGTYTFETSAAAVADVQTWVTEPDKNHGWVLISEDEDTPQTARRFASREDAANAPRLEITYTIPLRITRYAVTNSTFALFFPVEPQFQYTVQYNMGLTNGGWRVLTNFIERFLPYDAVAYDSTARNSQNFYRVFKDPL